MPLSKKRKKKGKPVKGKAPQMQAGLTLQDLINVVAYQEYVKDGTIVAPNVKVDMPDEVPVTVGEGEEKRQVGTAVKKEGSNDLSIEITDPDVASYLQETRGAYSIDDKEQD